MFKIIYSQRNTIITKMLHSKLNNFVVFLFRNLANKVVENIISTYAIILLMP